MSEKLSRKAVFETVSRRLLLLLIAAGVIAYLLSHYVFVSEQKRIERLLERAEIAVEDQSLFSCSRMVSDAYSDSRGFDRSMLLGAARQMFSRFEKIDVDRERTQFVHLPETTVEGRTFEAIVRVYATVTLYTQDGGAALIDPSKKHSILLTLVKEKGRWLLKRMEFENVDLRRYGIG